MQTLLRFLTLQLLILWQGGFLFYAIVVVPIGGRVLGNETLQGFITQRVTVWLNLIGYFCLIMLLVDSILHNQLRRIRLFTTTLSLGLLIALSVLHQKLDQMLDGDQQIVLDSNAFYSLHAIYLSLSGGQWLLMLIAAWLMLAAWRVADIQKRTS